MRAPHLSATARDNMRHATYSVFSTVYSVLREIVLDDDQTLLHDYQSFPKSKSILLFKDDMVLKYKNIRKTLDKEQIQPVLFDNGGHANLENYFPQVTKFINGISE